jgi:hypothetical protein
MAMLRETKGIDLLLKIQTSIHWIFRIQDKEMNER